MKNSDSRFAGKVGKEVEILKTMALGPVWHHKTNLESIHKWAINA